MARENPGSPEIPGSLENNSSAEINSASQENIFGPQSQQDQDGSSAPAPAPASEADAHESMATDLDPNKSDGQPEDTESDQPNGLDADGTISETASDALSSPRNPYSHCTVYSTQTHIVFEKLACFCGNLSLLRQGTRQGERGRDTGEVRRGALQHLQFSRAV